MQMESLIQEELSRVFDSASARGAFATHWRGPAADLDLQVKGVGAIRFPVSKATVKALRSVARPARFGQGEATMLDRRVRDSWVISKSRVKIDGSRWRQTLAPALDRIHDALELPEGTRLKARLHDMLVYEEGQFFLAHRDAEKTPDMIGTLVVLLPSSFEGGASVIAHEGEKVVVRGSSKKDLTFLAFFSDCEHEVKPVKKGHRVALTYELRLEGTPVTREVDSHALGAISTLIDDHFATPVPINWRGEQAAPDRLIYLLDHEYTPRGLSWRRLKGADAARAELLRQAADELDCDLHLATAEVHESWSCEPEDDGYERYGRYGHRHGWGYEDEDWAEGENVGDGEDHPPLTELHDTDVSVGSWVDSHDKPTGDESSSVEPGELCFSRSSDELTPFRLEHEGYMGNYGDTVDRWYHRAAVVLWPRSRAFVARGKHAAPWAAARVRETLDAGRIEDARSMVKAILPHWPGAARNAGADLASDVIDDVDPDMPDDLALDRVDIENDWEDDLEDEGLAAGWAALPKLKPVSESATGFASDLLHAAHGLDDAELAAAWTAPLTLDRVAVPSALTSLIQRYGADWLEARFEEWGKRNNWSSPQPQVIFQCLLPQLAEAMPTNERAVRAWLARRLEAEREALRKVLSSAADADKPSYVARVLQALVEPFVAVLRAAILAKATSVRQKMVEELVRAASRDNLRTWVVAVLRRARSAMTADELAEAQLVKAVDALRKALEGALATPPREPNDWSIDINLGCKCELCRKLGPFLRSRDKRTLDWPLAKERRQHVHRQIDARELPVAHTTRRQGRPFTLMLQKTDELFGREQKVREQQQRDLTWLAKWPGSATSTSRRRRGK